VRAGTHEELGELLQLRLQEQIRFGHVNGQGDAVLFHIDASLRRGGVVARARQPIVAVVDVILVGDDRQAVRKTNRRQSARQSLLEVRGGRKLQERSGRIDRQAL